jgi:hypothetical protein
MDNKEQLSQAIATVERQISEAKSELAKKTLTGKLERLKQELKSGASTGTSALSTLSKARKQVRAMAKDDFKALLTKLSKKPEYAFLAEYSQDRLKRDLSRTAKPKGYRFVGDNDKKPSPSQIKEGLKDGTVYYEGRPIRSDVSRVVKLAEGGSVSTETIDLKFYNVRGQVVESGKVIIDYDNETITLSSGKTYKVEPNREYTYKFLKTKIIAVRGIKGLSDFLKDINAPNRALNSVVRAFIDSDESKMAEGGSLNEEFNVRKGELQTIEFEGKEKRGYPVFVNISDNEPITIGVYATNKGAQKRVRELKKKMEMAKGGSIDDLQIRQISTMSGVRENVIRDWTKDNSLSSNDLSNVMMGLGRKQIKVADFVTAVTGEKDNSFSKEIIEYAKENKGYKMAEGGSVENNKTIGFIPMDLENDLAILAKWGGMNIREVIEFLNAMIDAGITDEDLKPKPIKNTLFQRNRAIESKIKEIWAKTKPFYKGELDEGNSYYSLTKRLVERSDLDILKKFKPFRKYQKFEEGGNISSFNWKNFTLKELNEALPSDVEISSISTPMTKDLRFSSPEFKKMYSTKNFTISEHGETEISKGSENIYLEIKCYDAEDRNSEDEYEVKIYSKENHKGLKEVANSVIEKMKKGGNTNYKFADAKIKFRKLAKSNNIDIVVAEGRFEVELDSNDKVKSIVHPNGNRHKASECPIYNKYKKEINHYIMYKYGEGGNIDNSYLGRTQIGKGHYGWIAKTPTKKEINGYDWEITTMKRHSGDLVSTATGGKIEDKGSFSTFTYSPFEDPSYRLVSSKPKMVNEKAVTKQHEEAIKIFLEKINEFSGDKMAQGGAVDNRMYYFLKDDLDELQGAIKENDQEEIERFFSYWNTHLSKLKPNKGDDRMYNFLEDDLVGLEKAIKENDQEEIERFFSYWNTHLSSLKMEHGGEVGNYLPPAKTYGENIGKAMEKFGISESEARKRYGSYTIKQWSELLKEKMENGGEVGDISKSEIAKMQKIGNLKGLYGYMPSVNTVYYDSRTDKFYFPDFEGDYMELKNIATLEQLHKFMKEKNITLDKKMATGGSLDKVKVGDIITSNTGVPVKVVAYDPAFGGRIKGVRMDEYGNGETSGWMSLKKFKFADGGNIDYTYLPNEDISKIVLKSKQVIGKDRVLDGAYIKSSKSNDPEMERAMRTLEKLKSEGKLKRLYDVRGNGKKSFETIIPNKEEKGYWKRYESASKHSLGILQNELLSEDDVLNIILKTQPKLSQEKSKDLANKFDNGGTIRKMYVGDPVLYKEDVWYVTEKDGKLGITDLGSGTYSSHSPFIEASRIDMSQLTDMIGRQVEISKITYHEKGGMVSKFFDGMTEKEILEKTIVYDGGEEVLDRYTVFTPDGSVYGMSESAGGFNQYVGDDSEIQKGSHLGKRLKLVPKDIQEAVLERMKEEEFAKGGNTDYTYVPNSDIDRIIAKDGKEYGQNVLLDGAYVTDKVRKPKMSRTQFEDETFEYGQGGNIRNDISKMKSKLIEEAKRKGLYENFGQKEVRMLEDKYGYTDEVRYFDEWAMNFDLSQLNRYARGGNIRTDISKMKSKLIEEAKRKGLYENFGQKEVRMLEDKYGYTDEVRYFDEWAMNFDLSQLNRYARGGGVDYQDIKKEKQKMTTELFEKCGVFFAFSEEQFEENKTPLKEGEKYVSIGGGGYMPKGSIKAFEEGMKAISNYGKQKVKQGNLAESEILYELQNHECFYTGDISDVVDLFEGTYTEKQIRDVYNKYREENQEYALGGEITAEEREQALKNSPKLNF